ncbi:MAG: hypothetical protein OXF93_18465 [Acidobacteria bacterium]|nr:hypothetical protein [Acidobacteriota bacterium]
MTQRDAASLGCRNQTRRIATYRRRHCAVDRADARADPGAQERYGDALLAEEASLLVKALTGHGRAMIKTSELMGLIADELHKRDALTTELIGRVERCAAQIEQPPSPPAWRSVLTGAGWALAGALAAILGMVAPLLWGLAR